MIVTWWGSRKEHEEEEDDDRHRNLQSLGGLLNFHFLSSLAESSLPTSRMISKMMICPWGSKKIAHARLACK